MIKQLRNSINMDTGKITLLEFKADLNKIQELKELALSILQTQIIPLRKELEQVNKRNITLKLSITESLKRAKEEFKSRYDEMKELCDKHGIVIETTFTQYLGPVN